MGALCGIYYSCFGEKKKEIQGVKELPNVTQLVIVEWGFEYKAQLPENMFLIIQYIWEKLNPEMDLENRIWINSGRKDRGHFF